MTWHGARLNNAGKRCTREKQHTGSRKTIQNTLPFQLDRDEKQSKGGAKGTVGRGEEEVRKRKGVARLRHRTITVTLLNRV